MSIVARLAPGGAERQLLDVLTHLRFAGFDCSVLCIGGEEGSLAGEFREQGIEVSHVRARSRVGPLSLMKLARFIRQNDPSIVHCHLYSANVTGSLAARLAGVPAVFATVHSCGEVRRPAQAVWARVAASVRAGTLAVSKAVAESFVTRTGVKADRVEVIPSGRDLARFRRSDLNTAELAHRLGIPPTSRVVSLVGRLVPEKRPLDFVEIATRLTWRHTDAVFVVAGEGCLRRAVEERVRQQGLSSRFRVMGQVDDVPALMRLSTVLVLPSEVEGLPLVLMEAAASGLPAVVSNVGGMPEIVADGETGYVVGCGELDQFAERIDRILSTPGLREQLSKNARVASTHYEISGCVEKLVSLYDSALKN